MTNKSEHIARLKISEIKHNDDGTSTLHFDLDDDFIRWFKEREGLKRFSHKRFQKFIVDSLANIESSGVSGKIFSENR